MNKRLLLWFILGIIIDKVARHLIYFLFTLQRNSADDFFIKLSMPHSWIFADIVIIICIIIVSMIMGSFIKKQKYWLILSMALGMLTSSAALIIVGNMIAASL